MSDTPNQNFKIVAAITGYTLRKSADGTEKYVLSGMASNANIYLTGERMADTALAAMAKSLEANAVTINNEHGNDWDDDFAWSGSRRSHYFGSIVALGLLHQRADRYCSRVRCATRPS